MTTDSKLENLRDLLARLEKATVECEALVAVIEEARSLARPGQSVPLGVSEWRHADSLLAATHRALSAAPASVLAAHDAKVRAEALRDAAEAAMKEAPDEPYAGATFTAHADWLSARADKEENR